MIYDLRFTNLKRAAAAFAICYLLSSISLFAQDGFTFLCDSNGVLLPGFTVPASNITGVVTSQLPSNVVYTATLLSVSNTVATNDLAKLLSASNTLATAQSNGTNWVFTNLLTSLNSASNYLKTNWVAPLNTASNLLATNWVGPLNTASNTVTTNLQAYVNTSSNALLALINADIYNWTLASNNIVASNAAALTVVSNQMITASNALATYGAGVSNNVITTSNALRTLTLGVSNNVVAAVAYTTGVSNLISGITAAKAFTAVVPATYGSIGTGFSTPLFADGNFSVNLTPQDQTTAESPAAGLFWWVGSKNASGFTIYLSYATNAYDLNFECQVKYNTQ